MFWINIVICYRNAIKNKYISLLNIFGLSVGLACSMILLSWVSYEFSFDGFFKNKENIYRLNLTSSRNNDFKGPWSHQGIGPEALSVFPEVKNFTRIIDQYRIPCKIANDQFYIDKGYAADSTFFSVFSFNVKAGVLSKSLNRKDLVVIDEYLANKCFGTKSALGETIDIGNHVYTVSAIIKDVPENSHLQFHYLIPILNQPTSWLDNKWGSDNCIQYLVLQQNVNKVEFENKLTQLLYNKRDTWKELKVNLIIQPLKEIHFGRGFINDDAAKGNLQNVYILISVAFLILLIACINFINMFISTSLKRIKSTGVKIVSGASKLSIFREFSIEVLAFVVTSFIISIVLVKTALPVINNLLDTGIEIKLFSLNFLFISLPVIALTLLMSSIFPGYYITRFNPVEILKLRISGLTGKRISFQNGLLTLQFVITILLIISVIAIHKQVNFINSKELGFDRENIAYISTGGEFRQQQNIQSLKNELIKSPNISSISSVSSLPTIRNIGGMLYTRENNENKVLSERISISEGYFELMKIKFIEGENELNNTNGEIQNCIINEIAAKKLNLSPPYTGQLIFDMNSGRYLTIKGVTGDVNTKSLCVDVEPTLYTQARNYDDMGIILFKLGGDYEDAIAIIKKYCQKFNSKIPFEFHFLDMDYDNLYVNEIRLQKTLGWFSLVSIILACIGLLAMAYFITENKTKEIGVRKINGAKVSEVMTMLNRDFVKWVVIAIIIATPIAYYVMVKWLENFAYKTELSWWIFALSGVLVLGIALITVSWQSWKAATRNPVEALRYE